MKRGAHGSLLGLLAGLFLSGVAGAIDITVMPDAKLQARYDALTHEIRCMTCQNNSIADSPAGLASDLRRDVREMLIAGKTDDEIRAYMVERYGNVILFSPPLTGSTAWVVFTPAVALVGGIVVAVILVRRRRKLVDTDDSPVDDEPAR
jgi:cytochrome c-type biogenesis protein CcmH